MKLVFIWLMTANTFLLPGELNLLHKPFTVCCVGHNIGKILISSASNIGRLEDE
jgi:hypothetical protein